MKDDRVLRHLIGDLIEVKAGAVVIGRDHVVVHHHGHAALFQPGVQFDVPIQKSLRPGFAVKQIGQGLIRLAGVPPFVTLG